MKKYIILSDITLLKHKYLIFLLLLETRDENGKTERSDSLIVKKIKKKKKKKHREDMRGRHLKMYNKEVQTVCAGLTLISKETLTPGECDNLEENKESFRYLKDEQLCQLNVGMQEYRIPQGVQSPFTTHQEHSVRNSFLKTGTKFSNFIHEEHQSNGGALVLHAYMDELSFLSPVEMERFAEEFLALTFSENEKNAAYYALAIVHGAAAYLPDFLDYFAFNFPSTPVKMEILGKKDIETTTISNFHTQVREITPTCLNSNLNLRLMIVSNTSQKAEIENAVSYICHFQLPLHAVCQIQFNITFIHFTFHCSFQNFASIRNSIVFEF